MPAAHVVLIRHGEARSGVDHVIGGEHGCRGLTDGGREEADLLRARLARTGELRPDVVYTSTLRRAVETAEIVGAAFPHITEIRRERDFCEQVPGICDGMPYLEAVERFAPEVDGPDAPLSPGGETAREFDARVRAAIRKLVAAHPDETVVVVTHGGFIAAASMFVLGAPGLVDVYPFRLSASNTSLTEFSAASPEPPWDLKRFNDTAHLFA